MKLGQLDLELWMQALLLAIIAVKIMRNLSTAKIWWSILLPNPNCYTFPCILVTSIWCKIKRITSNVLCLISLSIFSTCLLDNVFFNPIVILHLFRMDSCFDKILERPAKQDCRFLSKPLCRHNFFPTPAENDAWSRTSTKAVELHCAAFTLALWGEKLDLQLSVFSCMGVHVCTCFIRKQKQWARLVTSGSLTSETGWMI